ncbi:MAG: T9SS type A sorting domain-containing protein [Bacteroidota bacterium]
MRPAYRSSASSRLAWLRQRAAAGLLALPLLRGAPAVQAQTPTPVGPEFQVNTATAGNQRNPAVAVAPDGDFVIAWSSRGQDGSGTGIYAQRYTAEGTPAGAEFQVNTSTPNDQVVPSVGIDEDGDFVIAWASYLQDGDGYGIYAQRYAADGLPRGGEFQINIATENVQYGPSVEMDAEGDFVVAWDSYSEAGSYFDVFLRRYRADGEPRGPEVQANRFVAGTQSLAALGMNSEGDFVVAWSSFNQDRSGFGIMAKQYAADGTSPGPPFRVNTFSTGDQRHPAVAVDAGGAFVVAWQSDGQDGSGDGIAAQRYRSDGTPDGAEFQVNTVTENDQLLPEVGVDGDGDFVVVWRSYGQDGDDFGIVARRYRADGTPDGGEFQVNTFTTGVQYLTALGVEADGDFVVAWSSRDQDGDGDGIYAQRFAASPVGTEGGTGLPQALSVRSVHPNPTRDRATLHYALPATSGVLVTVTDVLGRTMLTHAVGTRLPGLHAARFTLEGLPTGTYVVRVKAGGAVAAQRITVVR